MDGSLMEDGFAHHVWATLRLIDTCLSLSPEQLQTEVPGTYGSILGTMRHLVEADAWYLFDTSGEGAPPADEDDADLAALRAVMVADETAWSLFLARDLDPNTVVREVDPTDGFQRDAPIGIRLAQALHHGTDHRSQICIALTMLGVDPPNIDVWDFGLDTGSVVDDHASGA
jgi:uncharacterized damage-inducible protein DinB